MRVKTGWGQAGVTVLAQTSEMIVSHPAFTVCTIMATLQVYLYGTKKPPTGRPRTIDLYKVIVLVLLFMLFPTLLSEV